MRCGRGLDTPTYRSLQIYVSSLNLAYQTGKMAGLWVPKEVFE